MSNLEWLKNRIDEIIKDLGETYAADFATDLNISNSYDIYDENSFEDAVFDYANNSCVDVYTSDLRDWAKDHMDEVSDTIDEYGWNTFKSMDDAIMFTQAREAEEEILKAESELIQFLAAQYILDNYDEDDIELIDVGHIVDDIGSWDEFSYIDSEIESSIEDYE